ncbi:MAG: squalene/phytoene synthase family protein [Parvibaculum sp.]
MTPELFRYCLDQLKRFDHDCYLAVLLAPVEMRAPLAALYAFEAELVRIPQTVSEPMLGEIRYQWWRDTLDHMTPASRVGHEGADALAQTLFDTGLAPSDLLPLIDFYAEQLTEEHCPTQELFVRQAERHAELMFRTQLALLGCDVVLDKKMLGAVTGMILVRRLRYLPFDAGAQRLTLPLDLMGAYDVDPHDVFDGLARPGLKILVGALLKIAAEKYAIARGLRVAESAVLHSLLPSVLVPLYVRKMSARDFDPLRHGSDVPAFRRQFRLLRVLITKHL